MRVFGKEIDLLSAALILAGGVSAGFLANLELPKITISWPSQFEQLAPVIKRAVVVPEQAVTNDATLRR